MNEEPEKQTIWSAARRRPGERGDGRPSDADPKGVRSLFQQDYDRLLFSSPVRRLSDKTQVWPMDANDSVRTRLTHSHEVANLARSIGMRVAKATGPTAFGGMDLHETVLPILAAIGLSHDLGNPPFGHQGETAIGRWFERRQDWIFTHDDDGGTRQTLDVPIGGELRSDFTSFDGNPQTLRIITRLQTSHHLVGLDLTAATLAASLKYPVDATGSNSERPARKKAGYFESERGIVNWIRLKTGLVEGQRHPLTWIMEACDDIAYSVLDVDDLLKKAIISPDDVLVVLKHTPAVCDLAAIAKLDAKFVEVNGDDRRAEIRRDIKEQYVRAYMIEALINDASDAYVARATAIEQFEEVLPLMEGNPLCDALKGIAGQYGFVHPEVLRSEALGAAAIDGLMSAFWSAIHNRKKPENLMSKRLGARDRYAFSLISPNYLEAACKEAEASGKGRRVGRYHELRLLTDMVSGMTDSFAIDTWRDLTEVPDVGRT
jgi:dGTPase